VEGVAEEADLLAFCLSRKEEVVYVNIHHG
jgi:hypothetical protein